MLQLPADARDPAYDRAILAAVASGAYEHRFVEVTSEAGGHKAVFLMSEDALQVEGVRWGMGAKLMQQVADLAGCLLPTIKLRDLLWLQRGVPLLPVTIGMLGISLNDMSKTKTMIAYSHHIDDDVVKSGGLRRGRAVQTTGKPWVLTNALLDHPGRACNYGWHFPGSSFGGSSWETSPTFPAIHVIQGPGFAHGLDQADYSETATLVHRRCRIDGVERDLVDVLADAELAPLASHEGVIRVPGMRQPGVDVYACPATGGGTTAAPVDGGVCPTPPLPKNVDKPFPWIPVAAATAGAALVATAGYFGVRWLRARSR